MDDVPALFLAILFGSVGLGYFLYGKKQQRLVPLACGLALMVFPSFVSGAWLVLIVGTALAALPLVARV